MSTFLEKLKKGMKTDEVSAPADEPTDQEVNEQKNEEAEEKTNEAPVKEEDYQPAPKKTRKLRAKKQPKAKKPIPEPKKIDPAFVEDYGETRKEKKEKVKTEEIPQGNEESKEEVLEIKNEGILATKVFGGEEEKKEKNWFETEGQLTVDVFQNDKELVVHSAIAGVKPEDIDITIENGVISIKGMRPKPKESQEPDYFYQECYWGKFSREIVIPLDADPAKAQATLKDGILCLRIPKAEKKQN